VKIKVLIFSILTVLALGAGAFWWLTRPQVIVFSDDSKLTLLGVDYGKRHVPPTVKVPASTNRASARRSGNGSFTTESNALVVWFKIQHPPDETRSYHFFIYDPDGKACTSSENTHRVRNTERETGMDVIGAEFDAFPRRFGKLLVRAQTWIPGGSEDIPPKKVRIANPVHATFPAWNGDPLPATRSDDNLSVTFKEFVTGVSLSYLRDQDNPDDAVNKASRVVFHVDSDGKPANNWSVGNYDLYDATGNHVRGYANNDPPKDGDTAAILPSGLWPGEPWKVRLEFSKKSGYDDSELWTIQNIPVTPGREQDYWSYINRNSRTNVPFAETDRNGIHLKIFGAKQFTDANPNSDRQGVVVVQARPAPKDGWELVLVGITDAQTNVVESRSSSSSYDSTMASHGYGMSDLSGVTNITVTLALHKHRSVEFTVKPSEADPNQ